MKLTIRSRHVDLGPELREQIHRRVAFALGRLAGAIREVEVSITDVNGPRGGADKLARIRVRGPALPTIVIEQQDSDSVAAVSVAVDRAARTVVRAIARRRELVGAPMA